MTYLLDTSLSVAVLRNVESVFARLDQEAPDDCAVSTVTRYELVTGAHKCRRPQREESKVERFIGMVHEVVLTREDAIQAASIRVSLERKGLKIGPYDLLLAGQALARAMILVTSNTSEFTRVKGLKVEDWDERP